MVAVCRRLWNNEHRRIPVAVATAVPLSEYLNTTYRPDCDYLEGELLERNVGNGITRDCRD